MDSTTKSSYSLEELVRKKKKKKNAKSIVVQNFVYVRQNFGYVCIPAEGPATPKNPVRDFKSPAF